MTKVIIFENANGTVGIFTPSPELIAAHSGDEATALAAVLGGVVPSDALSSAIVDSNVIPTNRKFRNAWEKSGVTLVENMSKARIIHMNKIREHRSREFLTLDVVRRNAEDDSDAPALAAAIAKRQTFRNIPQTSQESVDIAAATTPEALDAIWPTALLGERPADII